MHVAGIDLAASPRTTGVAVLVGRTVRHVEVDVDDDRLLELSADAGRVGIDCPLGWPRAFVDFVTAHQDGRPVPRADRVADRAPLAYRVTDVYCQEPDLRPLSVAADRIAHAAFRAAALLPRLTDHLDRSGRGRVIETYPAGSLLRWGFAHRGYKRPPNAATLRTLADDVIRTAGLHFARGEDAELVRTSDHAFDAVVAAITAIAVHRGLVDPIPAEHADAARVEGWIRLPSGRLDAVLPTAVP